MQEQDYILFEDYLSGQLDTAQKEAFTNRLHNDLEFKKAFDSYKSTSQFLEGYLKNEEKTKAFKENLKAISTKYFDKKEASKKKFRGINPWYYSIAAAAMLAIGFFITQQFSSPSYENYAHYGNISLTVRGTDNKLLSQAETAFNNKDYQEAQSYFFQLLKTDTNNMELQLYRAVSLVELNNYSEADSLFNTIIKTPSVYKNKAIWYLALSKLKQGDYPASLNVLKTLPRDAEDYKEAQNLMKELK